MVLYSIIASTSILILMTLIGPIELILLQKININMVENFRLSLKSGGSTVIMNGGLLLLILIVQPLAYCFMFIKLLDKIHNLTSIKKASARGLLGETKKRKGAPKAKGDLLLMVRSDSSTPSGKVSSDGSISIGSIYSLSNNKSITTKDTKAAIFAINMVIVRRSWLQTSLITLFSLALAITYHIPVQEFFILNIFCLVSSAFFPTLYLYNYALAEYAGIYTVDNFLIYIDIFNPPSRSDSVFNYRRIYQYGSRMGILYRLIIVFGKISATTTRIKWWWKCKTQSRLRVQFRNIKQDTIKLQEKYRLPQVCNLLMIIGEMDMSRYILRHSPDFYKIKIKLANIFKLKPRG